MGEKFPRILLKVANSTSLLGSFTCRKFTTWDRRLYFPSEGRRAEDFFARKSDGFGRVWTRKLGYQRPARLPLDHWSRSYKEYSRELKRVFVLFLYHRPIYLSTVSGYGIDFRQGQEVLPLPQQTDQLRGPRYSIKLVPEKHSTGTKRSKCRPEVDLSPLSKA